MKIQVIRPARHLSTGPDRTRPSSLLRPPERRRRMDFERFEWAFIRFSLIGWALVWATLWWFLE